MNILFYTLYHPSTMIGGIERITCRLIDLFSKKGYNIYCMYCADHDRKQTKIESAVKDEILITNIHNELEKAQAFIESNKIDIIINQSFFVGNISNSILESGVFWDMKFDCGYLRGIVDSLSRKCSILSCHHLNPGADYRGVPKNIHRIITDARSLSSLVWGIRNIGRYIRIKFHYKHIINEYYKELFHCSDRLILLSSTFKKEWMDVVGTSNEEKIISIPNMLSYKDYLDKEAIRNKEKIALVVARLDEHQKKIGRILKVWKTIEHDDSFHDWKLVIVGTGKDEERYKEYSSKNLQRVSFEGFQNPASYYKRSSVFLMTSAYEGFGITLIEAQQFGCVPIALNTYEALADIVEDDSNGYIANNMNEFEVKLKRMLSDSELRERLAQTAIESSKKFSEETVISQWEYLFHELS